MDLCRDPHKVVDDLLPNVLVTAYRGKAVISSRPPDEMRREALNNGPAGCRGVSSVAGLIRLLCAFETLKL